MSEGKCEDVIFEVSAGNHHRTASVVSAPCPCEDQANGEGCGCGCGSHAAADCCGGESQGACGCGCDCDCCTCDCEPGFGCDCGCDCDCCAPVECTCGEGKAIWELDDAGKQVRQVPAQWLCSCGGCRLFWVVSDLPAGATRRYKLAAAAEQTEAGSCFGGGWSPGVQVRVSAAKAAEVFVGGALFTSYVVKDGIARPYCYPVVGPGGLEITNFAPGDHIHHKSMYVAQGDVNGQDNWSEVEGHANSVNTALRALAEGPVLGAIRSVNDWVSKRGEKLLREVTRVVVYELGPDERLMDWHIALRADYQGVHFGDTKEAGTLSVRVAESMEERNGGRIVNAQGAVSEAECWGKRSPWVDYSGPVEGKKLGLAIFDHPGNFRHPTYWHVRSYGLFTANEWGLHDFTGDWSRRGDHVLPRGDKLVFDFRVYIHRGEAAEADVAGRYLDYAFPPKIERVEG